MDQKLKADIEASYRFLKEYEENLNRNSYGDWEARFHSETERLVDKLTGQLRVESFENFRGNPVFVADRPNARFRSFHSTDPLYRFLLREVLYRIHGDRRGHVQEMLDVFNTVAEMGFLDLLKKYPSPQVGNPLNWNHQGYSLTNRYVRHIFNLGMFKKYLEKQLPTDYVHLDLGSAYGPFSGVLKMDNPNGHHVLVDLPGQLLMAHYYLASLFPNARIADFATVGKAGRIDAAFIKQYDFVLLPTTLYDRLVGGIDLVSNFASLSEMGREWFEQYIRSEPFKKAPFLFTMNRYDAYPTYSNDITILDYPLQDYQKIFMRTCPFVKQYYAGFLYFFKKTVRYPSEFFLFIGKRK
ncbi:MAG: putative sugar O-methyltransferase [Magnetococcales bacterium]|nr:putative sugar O-methyltransferase [Magnetococcales bacterium]